MERTKEYGNGDRTNFSMVEDGQSMTPIAEFHQNWIACMTKANGEILNFVSRRLKQDMEAAAEFTKCKNPADLLQTQMQFVQQMTADYTEESQKLANIMGELTAEGMKNVPNRIGNKN